MFQNLRPNYYYSSIYKIPMAFYLEHQIKTIFADLDNTLVGDEIHQRPLVFERWYAELSNNNIELVIVSNNRSKKRVQNFVADLPIKWYYLARKQNGKLFKRLIKERDLNSKEIAVIGDRITTDVVGGNRAGLITVLTKPVIQDRNIFIRGIRIFEKQFIPFEDERGKDDE